MSEKTLAELELETGEYSVIRQRLVAEKHALQGMLAELNAKCAVRLPGFKFQAIQKERSVIVKSINEKETQIVDINTRTSELFAIKKVRREMEGERTVNIRALVEIRDQWHGFSMDSKNHQKAREAAWKFSQELGGVLKHYFNDAPAAPREIGSS